MTGTYAFFMLSDIMVPITTTTAILLTAQNALKGRKRRGTINLSEQRDADESLPEIAQQKQKKACLC